MRFEVIFVSSDRSEPEFKVKHLFANHPNRMNLLQWHTLCTT